MNIFFGDLIEILNMEQSVHILFICFLCVYTFSIILRVILCIGYQAQFMHFILNGKPIDNLASVRIKYFGVLNKSMVDYLRMANSGIHPINTKSIINKHVARINFLGLSFTSIESFVKALENSILFVTILFVIVFDEFKVLFAVAGVLVFMAIRALGSIFDFSLLKQKLTEELCVYIETEVGKFFVLDINKIAKDVIKEISDSLLKQSQDLHNSIIELNEILKGLRESYSTVSATNAALQSQMKYIEDNQGLLEQALNKYEIALEDITRKTGDAMGKMLEFYSQSSHSAIDESLKQNIKQIISCNNDLIKRFEQMFMQLSDQSRTQTETLVKLREEAYKQVFKN